jgi:hypothetical protein
MEHLARYIIRASFSQERVQYLDQEGKVVYTSKNGKSANILRQNHLDTQNPSSYTANTKKEVLINQ